MSATTTKKSSSTEAAKPPVEKLREGLLAANIWERKTGTATFFTATFERRYRDANGKWHSTHGYDSTDLLALAKLADRAHTTILALQGEKV